MAESVIVILVVLAAFVGVVYVMRKKLSGKDGCCDRRDCGPPPSDESDA